MRAYKKNIIPLSVTSFSYEGAILNAIKEAKKANKRIVKLGIPPEIQVQLTQMVDTGHNLVDYLKIKEIFGIPVEDSETLQITTEFSRFEMGDI